MSDRPIIVTGGAGFIGSHLCDALITRGEKVWAVDNFATGRRANVAHLIAHPALPVHRGRCHQAPLGGDSAHASPRPSRLAGLA